MYIHTCMCIHTYIHIYTFYNVCFIFSNMSAIFFTACCLYLMVSYSFLYPMEHFEDAYVKVSFILPYYTTFLEYRSPCLLSLLTTPAVSYFPSCSVNLTVGSPSAGEFFSVEVLCEPCMADLSISTILCSFSASLPVLSEFHWIKVHF